MSDNHIVNLVETHPVINIIECNIVYFGTVKWLLLNFLHFLHKFCNHRRPCDIAFGREIAKISVPHNARRPVVPDLKHLDVNVL